MAGMKKSVAMQVEQTANPDGSITIRPVAMAADRDIPASRAAELLGLDRKSLYPLCEMGEAAGGVKAWKLPGKRNSHWRISLQSVLSLRDRLAGDAPWKW